MLGIYDSGLGGITVLQELLKLDPELSVAYLGDTKYCPLGEKNPVEISKIVKLSIENLFDLGCNLVMLACNTATAVSIKEIQGNWLPTRYPDKKVLGIIRPTTELLIKSRVSKTSEIAVFATSATINTGFYTQELLAFGYRNCVQIAFPNLAGAIESQDSTKSNHIIHQRIIDNIEQLTDLDFIILACTHYPIVKNLFVENLKLLNLDNKVIILDQAKNTAEKIVEYCSIHNKFKLEKGNLQIFCTKDQQGFEEKLGKIFSIITSVKLIDKS